MTAGLQIEGHKLQYHPDRVADFLAGRLVWPVYAEVSPTSVCNHHCRFCNFNYLGHAGRRLPDGRMISLMDEFKRNGIKAVVFAGAGEPSLHPDTFHAARRARELGIDVAMSSNGVLLREEQLTAMAELLTWTRFSINGGTPESYAKAQGAPAGDFGKALAAVEALAARKASLGSPITIGTQCVLTPENKDTMKELAHRLKSAGADYLSIKHFYSHADNAYQPDMSFLTPEFVAGLRIMAAELSDNGFTCIVRDPEALDRRRPYRKCHGLPFIIYVREDGMLYTCFSHQDDPETAVGSLLDSDYGTLWKSDAREAATRHINECIDKNRCQANCRHHQINLWLQHMRHRPDHVNFI